MLVQRHPNVSVQHSEVRAVLSVKMGRMPDGHHNKALAGRLVTHVPSSVLVVCSCSL